MKIFVLGCNGMAGHLISLYFEEQGYDVVGFARNKSNLIKNTIVGDASNFVYLEKCIKEGDYDVIINCVGLLNQFAEQNKSMAVLLNGYLPHFLTKVTNNTSTRIIHMSTDCVFAGNDGPYYEDSVPNGTSFYDRSKAIGEINNDKDLTFRNSIIGPDIKESGIGLFNWFMKQKESINGFSEAIWTGVTTYTLAKAMEQAIKENLTGLYNLVNNESISKFNLCSLFNKYFRNDNVLIKPDGFLKLDKTLLHRRTDFSFVVPSYEQQIMDMRFWIVNHKSLYPHYELD